MSLVSLGPAQGPAFLQLVDAVRTHPYAVVLLDGDRALLHLGYARFAERLDGYLEMNQALRARVPEIEYVDLRFEGRMYVRPADGPDARRASAMRTDRD